MSLLRANQLIKRYKGNNVVDNLCIEINSGEIVGLLGPNGAGKTTSFYMIVGLIRPNEGEILLDNKKITKSSMYHRSKLGIGYLPQEASIFRKLSVADNIMAILQCRKNLNPKQRQDTLEQLLTDFHISHIAHTMGYRLSGGERKRVEIARALAINPKFILLDEPFAGVDPISIIDIKHIIGHLRDQGVGILITDHNVREALDICERAYIMNHGKTICEGSPQDILKNQQVRSVYLGDDFNL